jgi:hypothetical protein
VLSGLPDEGVELSGALGGGALEAGVTSLDDGASDGLSPSVVDVVSDIQDHRSLVQTREGYDGLVLSCPV